MRLIQDIYSKKLLQEALDPVNIVELEDPIAPHDEQYSDVLCRPLPNRPPLEEVPHLGLLWSMTAVLCTIEPCSKTPTVYALRGYARKQLSRHHQLCKETNDEKTAVPPQWVISPGRPETGLLAMPAMAAEGWPTGFYRSGELLGIWIVVLSELPKTAETRLLRLMGPEGMRQEVRQEIVGLLEEDATRGRWLEILEEMVYFLEKKKEKDKEVAVEERREMTELRREFLEFKAAMRKEGEVQGEARGEARGKALGKAEALLAVLLARGIIVNDVVRSQILACQDGAKLDQWVVKAVTASSASEVLAAAA